MMEWDKTCSGTPGPIASVVSRAIMVACLRLIPASTCVSIQVKQPTIKRPTVDKMAVLVVMEQALSYTSRALFSGLRTLLMLVEMSAVQTQHSKITTLLEELPATLSIHQNLRWYLKMKASIRDVRETSNSHDSLIRYRILIWSSSSWSRTLPQEGSLEKTFQLMQLR